MKKVETIDDVKDFIKHLDVDTLKMIEKYIEHELLYLKEENVQYIEQKRA